VLNQLVITQIQLALVKVKIHVSHTTHIGFQEDAETSASGSFHLICRVRVRIPSTTSLSMQKMTVWQEVYDELSAGGRSKTVTG